MFFPPAKSYFRWVVRLVVLIRGHRVRKTGIIASGGAERGTPAAEGDFYETLVSSLSFNPGISWSISGWEGWFDLDGLSLSWRIGKEEQN